MCLARSVWEIRSSSRHFRIVFPGGSERAISPAIFSRSWNSTLGGSMSRPRRGVLYKSVEDGIGRRRGAPGRERRHRPSRVEEKGGKKGKGGRRPSEVLHAAAEQERPAHGSAFLVPEDEGDPRVPSGAAEGWLLRKLDRLAPGGG